MDCSQIMSVAKGGGGWKMLKIADQGGGAVSLMLTIDEKGGGGGKANADIG